MELEARGSHVCRCDTLWCLGSLLPQVNRVHPAKPCFLSILYTGRPLPPTEEKHTVAIKMLSDLDHQHWVLLK